MEDLSKSIYCDCMTADADDILPAQAGENKSWVLQAGPDGSIRIPADLLMQTNHTPGGRVLLKSTAKGLTVTSLEPEITRLYIEPTNSCNLSCSTCIRHSWTENEGMLEFDTYKKIISEASNLPALEQISFWGFGEPLLHPRITEMVVLAKQLGVRTQLITNGLLINLKIAKGLVAAGLDSIVVSVDGTNPLTHAEIRPGADLLTIKEHIQLLRDVRDSNGKRKPEIGLEFVAMRKNIDELKRLREFAAEVGAAQIIITNVIPYSEDLKDEILYSKSADFTPSVKGYSWSPELILPPMDNSADAATHLATLFAKDEAMDYLRQAQRESHCRFVGDGTLAISWDGKVSPCIALMHSHSCYVLGRKKDVLQYTVGNIRLDTLTEIWQEETFKQFRERVLRFDFSPCTRCSGCNFTETNEEDCFGNTFPVCGDCLWAQGVILCP